MYKLYYSPAACSMAVHVVLNELNQETKLVDTSLAEGKNRDAEFLKVNPRGQVPVLVDDGHVVREGAAIMVYLMDKHASALLPKSGFARATALQWLMYGNATLHMTYSKAFMINRAEIEDAAKAALTASIVAQINAQWAELDAIYTKQPYICGNDISAADILFAVIANWEQWLPATYTITLGDNVKRMIKSVIARPAYQKALASENVEYKTAA